jgi:putative oxidoreductase
MKTAIIVARVLLGVVFVVFGLNAFLHFLKPPMPKGEAGAFLGAMFASHYFYVVAALQITGGALCLLGRYLALGLTLLGPVIVNIVCFHVFLEHDFLKLLQPAFAVTALWLFLMFAHRSAFAPIFRP